MSDISETPVHYKATKKFMTNEGPAVAIGPKEIGEKIDQQQLDAEAEGTRIANEVVAQKLDGIVGNAVHEITLATKTKSIHELQATFKGQLKYIREMTELKKISRVQEKDILTKLQTGLEAIWQIDELRADTWRLKNESVGPWTEEIRQMKQELSSRIAQLNIAKSPLSRS